MDIVYYIWQNGDFVWVSKNRFYEQMRYYKYHRINFNVSESVYYSGVSYKDKFLRPSELSSK